jgi:Helix-turn-helix domain
LSSLRLTCSSFGVTQPRISDLVRGKIELFSIDMLVTMLARAGVHVNVAVSPLHQGAAVRLHCYVDPKQLASDRVQEALGDFCRRLGRETNQGEVGLIIDNEYFAFTKF